MAGGRFWTTCEVADLSRWLAEGVKFAVIAKRLGRSYSAVAQRASTFPGRDRVPRIHRPGELSKWVARLCIPGVSDSDVGGILGVTRRAVWSTRRRLGIPPGCRKHGKRCRPERAPEGNDARFLRLYSGVGRSDGEIAELMGVSKWVVYRTRRGFGLPGVGAAGPKFKEAEA